MFGIVLRVTWAQAHWVSEQDVLGTHPMGGGPTMRGVKCGVQTLDIIGRSWDLGVPSQLY